MHVEIAAKSVCYHAPLIPLFKRHFGHRSKVSHAFLQGPKSFASLLQHVSSLSHYYFSGGCITDMELSSVGSHVVEDTTNI